MKISTFKIQSREFLRLKHKNHYETIIPVDSIMLISFDTKDGVTIKTKDQDFQFYAEDCVALKSYIGELS